MMRRHAGSGAAILPVASSLASSLSEPDSADSSSELGVRLLNRTTRAASRPLKRDSGFTNSSRRPSPGTTALDAVNLFRESPTGTLRLNVPTIAAREILPDLLSRFLAAHPGITVDIGANDTFIDILAAGFDAGIRYDERLERDMIAVPVGPRVQRFVAAAARHPLWFAAYLYRANW